MEVWAGDRVSHCSLIGQIFMEHLLCADECNEQSRHPLPPLMDLTLQWGGDKKTNREVCHASLKKGTGGHSIDQHLSVTKAFCHPVLGGQACNCWDCLAEGR